VAPDVFELLVDCPVIHAVIDVWQVTRRQVLNMPGDFTSISPHEYHSAMVVDADDL
jgi:hypothetical protein